MKVGPVALRKESVDRNTGSDWVSEFPQLVALRKESVDRNFKAVAVCGMLSSRSPQGERG